MKPTDRIFHISHNDLDGYGCQFIISRSFYNVCWYNCDYKDIEFTISAALKQIKMEILAGKSPALLLISDINISLETAKNLEQKLKALPQAPQLLLLDHHTTGKECAEQYPWYQLDTRYCATVLTYQWVKQWLPKELAEYLQNIAELVNVTDLWQTEHLHFKKANLLADLIFDKNFFTHSMENEFRHYTFHLIDNVYQMVAQNCTIVEIEKSLYDIKLKFLKDEGIASTIVDNPNITLDGKYQELVYQKICENPPPVVTLDNYQIAVFYRWQGTTFQHISSKYLGYKKHIDIAMRVGTNAHLSIRSRKPTIDVGQLAKKYFKGGGHPQAAGGLLPAREIKNEAFALKLLRDIAKTFSP